MLLVLSWISATFFFSSAWIFVGFVAKYPVPMEYMMFYRMTISVVILFVIALLKRTRIIIRKYEILPSFLISLSQLNNWLTGYGTKYLISGLVPCITLTQIFIAEAMSAIVEKRKMRCNIILSGIIGIIGIIMLCNQQLVGIGDAGLKNTCLGILFSFLSTFFAAGGNLIYEKCSNTLSQMSRTTFLLYNCLFSSVIFLLLGIILNPVSCLYDTSAIDAQYIGMVSFLSITATIISLYSIYYIIEKQGAIKVAYLNFITPILSMIISTIYEGFKWNTMAVMGMIILMFSVWIGTKQAKQTTKHPTTAK